MDLLKPSTKNSHAVIACVSVNLKTSEKKASTSADMISEEIYIPWYLYLSTHCFLPVVQRFGPLWLPHYRVHKSLSEV